MNPIAQFLRYLRTEKRVSSRTYCLYAAALRDAYAFLYADRNWRHLPELGNDLVDWERQTEFWPLQGQEWWDFWKSLHIRSYLSFGMSQGLSALTLNLRMSAFSSFCEFAVRRGWMDKNPVRSVARPKKSRRLPEFYKSASLEKYFACFAQPDRTWDFPTYRNRMLLLVLYGTGMRRSEVVHLQVKDYDVARSLFRVVGKGDKEREIPVPIRISQEIVLYLERVKETFTDAPPKWFFVTDKGNQLYPQFVNIVVKKELGGLDGFSGKKSPHVLRHSLATHLLNNGTDLNSIKEVLGHSSLAATQVYTHNSFEKLKEAYITAHPRAKNGGKYGH